MSPLTRDERAEEVEFLRFAARCFRPGESHGADDEGVAGAQRDRERVRALADKLESEPDDDSVARLKGCRAMLDDAHRRLDELGAPRHDDADLPPTQSVTERIGWVVAQRSLPSVAERDEAREALRGLLSAMRADQSWVHPHWLPLMASAHQILAGVA